MSKDFGDDFISITDDEGNQYDLEVLAEVEYNGMRYLGVCPADGGDGEQPDLEVSILRVEDDNGEDVLCSVTDDEELEAVYALLLEEAEQEIPD